MMLGPMKKKMIATGVVCALIPIILFAVFFMIYSSKKKAEVEKLKKETAVVERYIISGDLPINHIINENDVKLDGVKEISAPIDSYTSGEKRLIIGRELKIPVMSGTIITDAMFYTEDDSIDKDVRVKEYNMISLPSDLQKGDYIDIRITFPTGENYLVVAGQEVMDVGTANDSNTIFLDVSEENLLRLDGAILESYISSSVSLYAVKYRNPDVQLYKEEEINYVELYEETVEKLIEERTEYEEMETSEVTLEDNEIVQGEDENKVENEFDNEVLNETERKNEKTIKYRPKREELDEEVAILIGLKKNEVEAIRMALQDNDKEIIRLYSNKVKRTRTAMLANYPVRPEVAMLIAKNPNIVSEIRTTYNVEELIAQRENLIDTSIYRPDEETGEIKEHEETLTQVAENLAIQIQAQRDERRTYLQNLVRNSLVTTDVK